MCVDVQQIGALTETDLRLSSSECISCRQCVVVCPTYALQETSSISRVLTAPASGKTVLLQTAPAVKVAIGDAFNEQIGSVVTARIVGAARAMGFKFVVDTNFGADLTIVEEATELIERLHHHRPLPMFTSCCPAWINFVEKLYPELIPHLSTCKSLHMMVGAIARPYFAARHRIRQSDLYVVSVMPCVAKKTEIERMKMHGDVDAVITAREFIRMMAMMGIDWRGVKTWQYDPIMGHGWRHRGGDPLCAPSDDSDAYEGSGFQAVARVGRVADIVSADRRRGAEHRGL
jgi:iron only hydrogenase large subunit-like protein